MQLGNTIYLLPLAIIEQYHSHLKVVNLGYRDKVWEARRLIARTKLVTIPVCDSEFTILNMIVQEIIILVLI